LRLDGVELAGYKWLRPKDALKLDLAEGYFEALSKFIEYLKNKPL